MYFVTIVSPYDNIDVLPSLQEDFDFWFDLLINIHSLFSISAFYNEIYRYFLGNDSLRTFSFFVVEEIVPFPRPHNY